MKISNGYMLGFGLVAVAFSLAHARQNVTPSQIMNRTPAQVTYTGTGTGNTVTVNGVQMQQNTTLNADGTVSPVIPQIATYNDIDRTYGSAIYNETSLRIQQDAIATQLADAQTARAQIAIKSPMAVMYPNNSYDVAIKNLQFKITQMKTARADNLTNAIRAMDFTYVSVKYSMTRDQMMEATLKRNNLVKLSGDINSDITLPTTTTGLPNQDQTLIDMLAQYQASQTAAPVAALAATPIPQQPDLRTYTMPDEPVISAPAVDPIAPTTEEPSNNAESSNQVISPTPENYTNYTPVPPVQ